MLAAVPLVVQPLKGQSADGRGKLVFAVDKGTAYGLDAATGKLLWRRFVALDPKLAPVSVLPRSSPTAGNVVLCDPVHQELLCVNGATGRLVWRLVVGEPILADPVRAGKRLLLLTKENRLRLIDLATGDSSGYVQLPQAIRLSPVVDSADGLVFLVGDQSNLIVLDMGQGGRCRQVVHLGHEAAAIAAPPAVLDDFLLVPINDSPAEATLRILAISKGKEGEPLKPVQAIRLAGHVDATPAAVGHGAAVVTAEGSLFALDRSEAGSPLPFRVVASRQTSLKERAKRYLVSGGAAFWVADEQLTRYAVNVDQQRLVPRAVSDVGVKFAGDPSVDGGTVFDVFKKRGMPGVTVSALDIAKNEPVWQTWVGAPLVAEPVVDQLSGKLTAVTASGGMFREAPDGLKPSVPPWQPVLAVESTRLLKPLVSLLPLSGERFAMTSGAETAQIVIYDPKKEQTGCRWLLSPREMAVAPELFAGGLLTPCVDGQVFLLDPDASGEMAKPLAASRRGRPRFGSGESRWPSTTSWPCSAMATSD